MAISFDTVLQLHIFIVGMVLIYKYFWGGTLWKNDRKFNSVIPSDAPEGDITVLNTEAQD